MLGWLSSHVETGAPPDPPVGDNLDNRAALPARGVSEDAPQNCCLSAAEQRGEPEWLCLWRDEDVQGGMTPATITRGVDQHHLQS